VHLSQKISMSSKKDTYTHGFNVPDSYFENFEARFFKDMNLSEIPENGGFTVPDGYFEALDARLNTASTASEVQPKVIQLIRNKHMRYVAAIAACAILIVSLVKNSSPSVGTMADIELTEISEYIETENLDFDTFDVLALLQEDELTDLNTQNQYITDELLESYLFDTLDDATLLTE
jgi:hypothetical protein